MISGVRRRKFEILREIFQKIQMKLNEFWGIYNSNNEGFEIEILGEKMGFHREKSVEFLGEK